LLCLENFLGGGEQIQSSTPPPCWMNGFCLGFEGAKESDYGAIACAGSWVLREEKFDHL